MSQTSSYKPGGEHLRKLNDYKQYSKRGMEYNQSDINKIPIFQAESYKHWIAKCTLFFQLRRIGHDVIGEFVIPGLGVGDLFDLDTSVQYEIEFSGKKIRESKAEKYKRTGVEIIVVNCNGMPTDIKDIQKFLDPYIIVD